MDFDRHTFVEKCQRGGFTPFQALVFYDELRKFCAPQIEGLGNPRLERWEKIRSSAAENLQRIHTVAEFEDYCKSWGVARHSDSAIELKNKLNGVDRILSMRGFIPREEAVDRISGMMAIATLPQWRAWKHMDLQWEDVQAAVDADVLNLPLVQAPEGMGMEQARQALRQATQDAGLAGISWPLAQDHTPDTLWSLAQSVRQSSVEISAQTDLDKSLTGLNGRIFLRIGQGMTGDSGLCTRVDEGFVVIHSSARVGWGSFAHEWTHALEGVLHPEDPGTGMTANLLPEIQQQWQSLHRSLQDTPSQEVSPDRIKDNMRFSILFSLPTNPSARAALEALTPARASRKAVFEKLLQPLGLDDKHLALGVCSAHAVAIRLMAEVELAQGRPDPGKSVWISYAERFSEICREVLPSTTADKLEDYFLDPEEQLAHSFESTFLPDSLVSDAGRKISFRYPIEQEADMHQDAWRRFFQTAGPLIQKALELPGQACAPDMPTSLSQTRQKRKEARTPSPTPASPTLRARWQPG